MKNGNPNREELDPVGMIQQLACCFTQQRMMASQVAVLTMIARNPAITSGPIVRTTGLSVPNTGRILNYLADVGDVTFVREGRRGPITRPPGGISTSPLPAWKPSGNWCAIWAGESTGNSMFSRR